MTEQTPSSQGTVLLIEDNAQIAAEVSAPLTGAGYRVIVSDNGKQALADIFKQPPDIIILDINLPDLDGFHVAKELKRNMMLRHIPVILLCGRTDFLEKMKTLDVPVDEYIVKPIDQQDLLLRTRLVLQRVQSNLDANPLTHLPGNHAIMRTLKNRIASGQPFAVGYADLNNFKAYNDKYGFGAGDQVIRFSAQLIVSTVEQMSPKDGFIGHVGGDDFVFVCDYAKVNDICQAITDRFDKEIVKFYPEEDRKKGFIVVEDRKGVVSQFPFVSVAIGVASDEGKKFTNIGQINNLLSQLKKYAKSFQGSAYVRDRRSPVTPASGGGGGDLAGLEASLRTASVLTSITSALGALLPRQLDDVIRNRSIVVLFQPILDMQSGDDVVGHESLARGPAGALENPATLFQTARTAGRVVELDILCLQRIMEASMEFRKGMQLFVNIFPETLIEGAALFRDVLADPRIQHSDWVFELSGANRETDPVQLFAILTRIKQLGHRICIDAPVAMSPEGLKRLPDLKPDYVKLDISQYTGMVEDANKLKRFLSDTALLRRTGAEVICTRLESRTDSTLAVNAGVRLGQGFLFARPIQTRPASPAS